MVITTIDDRGRIVLPKEVREALGLVPNQALPVTVQEDAILLRPAVEVGKFMSELKGCVRGSGIKPESLKEIWGVSHSHH